MERNPWLIPALLVAGLIALWLWFRSSARAAAAAAAGAAGARPGFDPNAALGAAACQAGIMAFGGTTAGLAGAPLCTAAGSALGPLVGAGVKGAANLLTTQVDAIDSITSSVAKDISGAATLPLTLGRAVGTVASDVYGGTKDVVSDVAGAVGSVGGAVASAVAAPFKAIGGLFSHHSNAPAGPTPAQIAAANAAAAAKRKADYIQDCVSRGGKYTESASGGVQSCDLSSGPKAAYDWRARGL
jgi:hypothetical protein